MNELCMQLCTMQFDDASPALYHHGIMGMKWGVRRYQPYGSGGYDPDHIGKNTGLAARIAKGLGGLSGGLREAGERARFGTHKLGGAIDRGLLKAKRKGSSALSTLSAIGNTDVRDIGRMAKRKASDLRGMSQSGELERMLRSGLSQMGAKAAMAGKSAALGTSLLASMLEGPKPGEAYGRLSRGQGSGKTTNLTNLSSSLSDIHQYHGRQRTQPQKQMYRGQFGHLFDGTQEIGDSSPFGTLLGGPKHTYDNTRDDKKDFLWGNSNYALNFDGSGTFGKLTSTGIRSILDSSTTKSGRSILDSLSALALPPEADFTASMDARGVRYDRRAYSPSGMKALRGQLSNL